MGNRLSIAFRAKQWGDIVRIPTDDCDKNDNQLVLFAGGNGDMYLAVRFRDDGGYWNQKEVRLATSGGMAQSMYPGLLPAIANAYRAALASPTPAPGGAETK